MSESNIAARTEARSRKREKEAKRRGTRAAEREGKRETREGILVRGPRVPEPILPSYLNSNSKYRRGLLTYCLFRLGRGDSERG